MRPTTGPYARRPPRRPAPDTAPAKVERMKYRLRQVTTGEDGRDSLRTLAGHDTSEALIRLVPGTRGRVRLCRRDGSVVASWCDGVAEGSEAK